MSTILILLLTISLLILVHELGHFFAAKWGGIKVDEFAIGMGPRLVTLFNDGETDYTIRVLPIGGFVKMQGEDPGTELAQYDDPSRSFENKSVLIRSVILVAGITMNYIVAILLIAAIFIGVGKPEATTVFQITHVAENSPAADAQISIGDTVVAYKTSSGEEYRYLTVEHFSNFIQNNAGAEITLVTYHENGTPESATEVTLVPRVDPPDGEGAIGIQYQPTYYVTYTPIPLWRVPGESIITSVDLVVALVQGLGDMAYDLVTQGIIPEGIAGPIGVAKLTSDAAKEGVYSFLSMVALISVNLAVVNILPFPALDGGRLVFVVIEGITGRKVLRRYEGWIHFIGFILLIILVAVLSFYDVQRFL